MIIIIDQLFFIAWYQTTVMILINAIIFSNYMVCKVYLSYPWCHGYPADIPHPDSEFQALVWSYILICSYFLFRPRHRQVVDLLGHLEEAEMGHLRHLEQAAAADLNIHSGVSTNHKRDGDGIQFNSLTSLLMRTMYVTKDLWKKSSSNPLDHLEEVASDHLDHL